MMMTLDFVAQRYGVLPSELLERGNSLDIIIADKAQSYMNELQKQAQAKSSGHSYTKPAPELSEKEMLDMLDRVKQQGN